ncbi:MULTISPECIES: CGNR zinc finger domain-containing protein [Streptomyces]|uniref:CGNR zinc finger domain-containing protein n=1 Tax=Streptomyces TaxID=1883 RepID=UPI001E3BB707|nr:MULTISPECIES: CGNR zinc finger domain-containing protein [Streptomyces]UFQ19767.1 ABATE domain-containing protein [Streptomyces huasconensis]WCL89387.1 CGNR zinc finger domain-containing protein [Streptomyces sp. JCM 35825]
MAPSAPPGILMRARSGATYRFDPGALCLELLTTGGPGEFRRHETLRAPEDLVAWAGRSRLTPTPALDVSALDVAHARRLRDALFRVSSARAAGAGADPADLGVLNAAAAHPPLVPSVGPDGGRRWAPGSDGAGLLSTVARDAVELLTGPFGHRVRACASDECRLIYVDTSRPGRRRWCAMEHCGNLHKVRTLRARRAADA